MSAETIYTDPEPARVALHMVKGRPGGWGASKVRHSEYRTARNALLLAAFGRRCVVCGCGTRSELRPVHTTPSGSQLAAASAAHAALLGKCPAPGRTAFYLSLAATPGIKLACHRCTGLLRLRQHLTAFHSACCGPAAPIL